MFKKHALSPNHKVVTDSPHNFHPHGTKPSTASMGSPPASLHGGPDGPAMPGEGGAGPVESFCNGGMKYADGGEILGGGIRGKMADYGSAIKQTLSDMTKPSPRTTTPNGGERPSGPVGKDFDDRTERAVKDAGG